MRKEENKRKNVVEDATKYIKLGLSSYPAYEHRGSTSTTAHRSALKHKMAELCVFLVSYAENRECVVLCFVDQQVIPAHDNHNNKNETVKRPFDKFCLLSI